MARTLPFGSRQFKATLRELKAASLCPTCKKSTIVTNIALRGFRAEPISDRSHCTCPGGPVDLKRLGALSPLHLLPIEA